MVWGKPRETVGRKGAGPRLTGLVGARWTGQDSRTAIGMCGFFYVLAAGKPGEDRLSFMLQTITSARQAQDKTTVMNGTSRLSGLIVALFLAPLFVSISCAQQATEENITTDEQRLIQLVKQEVLEELRNGEFLRQQIELGIQAYVKSQQDAQVAVRAEKRAWRTRGSRMYGPSPANGITSMVIPRRQYH